MEWKKWLHGRQSKLREEDTDWKRWLLGKPYRPFDPHVYLEFRLYKDYSSGIFDQWLSHGSDLVHLWTDENYPVSVVANGGIYAWPDGRRKSRYCVAAVTYPKGFLYTYKTIFRQQLSQLLPNSRTRRHHRKLWRRRRVVVYGEQRRRQT